MIKMVYMIRHKKTGLYKLGGDWKAWSKKGKVWAGIGALKNHLNLHKHEYLGSGVYKFPDHVAEEMKNWEVVAIQVSQAESHTFTIEQLYQ